MCILPPHSHVTSDCMKVLFEKCSPVKPMLIPKKTLYMADFQNDNPSSSDEEHMHEKPPIGGSWGLLYTFVLGELALLIVLFYFFSKAYA